jgi:GntR family transcriptional regulator
LAAANLQLVRTAAPLYRDVATALERAIRDGVWKAGDQIPTEAELEIRFHSSRGTLRMAVAELVRRGLLHRQPGRGTFVLGPTFDTFERYFRYESLEGQLPLAPSNRVLGQGVTNADAQAAAALGVAVKSRVGYLKRLRLNHGEPFLLVDSYFPLEVWHEIERADLSTHPLYDLFKNQFGLYVVSADEFLRADLVSAREAKLLRITPGNAVIRLERTAFTFESRPMEYRRAVGRADRFRYHVRLE